jgi:hypothetical protein
MNHFDRLSYVFSLGYIPEIRSNETPLDNLLATIRFLLPLCLFLLGGCATMSKDECLSGNWYDSGYRDGVAGYAATRFADHQKACAEYGVSPEPNAYFQGRDAGLQIYCDLYHAIEEGLAGRQYRGVCSGNIDAAYRQLNDAAYRVYDLRNDIRTRGYQIDSLEQEWRKDKTAENRRKEIRHKIHNLEREQDRLRDQLNWQEHDLDRLSDEILHRNAPSG